MEQFDVINCIKEKTEQQNTHIFKIHMNNHEIVSKKAQYLGECYDTYLCYVYLTILIQDILLPGRLPLLLNRT